MAMMYCVSLFIYFNALRSEFLVHVTPTDLTDLDLCLEQKPVVIDVDLRLLIPRTQRQSAVREWQLLCLVAGDVVVFCFFFFNHS